MDLPNDLPETPRAALTDEGGEPPVNRGGTHTHRPGCKCNPCRARRRKEEALTLGVGPNAEVAGKDPNAINVNEANLKSPKARVHQWIYFRNIHPDATQKELAGMMGISHRQLQHVIAKGRNEGWLKFTDPLDSLEHEVIPKVVQNLNYWLDQKDKTVTIETAKGTIFKQFAESKGLTEAPSTVLALKIEQPEGGYKVSVGHIVGRPKQQDDPIPADGNVVVEDN
jgi:hypothetical protein